MAIDENSVLRLFSKLNVWKRGGERAPHKPLLVLLALGRLQAGKRWLTFPDVDARLKPLLLAYGRPGRGLRTEYPFWRLQNDGLWEIPGAQTLTRRASNTDALRSELLLHKTQAGFSDEVYDALAGHPDLVEEVARRILAAHFPASLHDDIAVAAGLSLDASSCALPRDIQFRDSVLRAYEYRCAICGYDGRLGDSALGLEAGHIKWHSAGGPCTINNGLALCSFHHKAFDMGALSLDAGRRVLVSEHVHGSGCVDQLLLSFAGSRLKGPIRTEYAPAEKYVEWHHQEVFRRPARRPL